MAEKSKKKAASGGDQSGPEESVSRDSQTSRRDFITRAGKYTAGVCTLALAAGAVRLATPDVIDGPPLQFAVGRLADFKMRTTTWLREHDLFIIHDTQGFGALSARCTHLGCTVQRTGKGFSCPCHGARFDPQGRVLSGPAREDLPWFQLHLRGDGKLWVACDKPQEPGTRPRADLEQDKSQASNRSERKGSA